MYYKNYIFYLIRKSYISLWRLWVGYCLSGNICIMDSCFFVSISWLQNMCPLTVCFTCIYLKNVRYFKFSINSSSVYSEHPFKPYGPLIKESWQKFTWYRCGACTIKLFYLRQKIWILLKQYIYIIVHKKTYIEINLWI